MTSIAAAFAERFGQDQADAVMQAAESHQNGVHDNRGADPFKWAICICIGYECMTVDRYRQHHGITADPDEIKTWVYENADLGTHDGDVDYLGLMAGIYDGWLNPDSAAWSASEATR